MPNVTVRQFAEMTHTSPPNIYKLVKKHGLYVKGMYIKAKRGKLMYITEEGQELLRDNIRQPEMVLYDDKEKDREILALREQLADARNDLASARLEIASQKLLTAQVEAVSAERDAAIEERDKAIKERDEARQNAEDIDYMLKTYANQNEQFRQKNGRLEETIQQKDEEIERLRGRSLWQRILNK